MPEASGRNSEDFAAQLRKDSGDFTEQIIAVRALKLVDAFPVPPLFTVVDQLIMAAYRLYPRIEVRVEKEGKR